MTDEAFLARFEATTLDAFAHRDHVRVAYAYTRDGGVDDAVARTCAGLRRLTAAAGQADKYHETLTTAWARVIAHHAATHTGDFDAFLDAHPRLLDRELLLAHYSRERLFSAAARAAFVGPDRAPLP